MHSKDGMIEPMDTTTETTMKPTLLVQASKHQDSYYLCRSPEERDRAYFKILEAWMRDGYLYPPHKTGKTQADREALSLVKTGKINTLPENMRRTIEQHVRTYESVKRREEKDTELFEMVQQLLKMGEDAAIQQRSPNGRFSKPENLVKAYAGGEYMEVYEESFSNV